MDWTIQKILEWATKYFQEKGIGSPRLDAELLLSRALDLDRVQLYVQYDRPLEEAELKGFKALVQRRAAREPLPYILGQKEFFMLNFEVNASVLIPRPETEELVTIGLAYLQAQGRAEPSILDLASGSGCIPIALLKNLPNARAVGAEISAPALEVARRNAARHGVENRVRWVEADLSRPWPELDGPFDLITANLPYVSAENWVQTQPEIQQHEPQIALTAGPGGLQAFRWVFPHLPGLLRPRGMAICEMAMDQGEALQELAAKLCPELSREILTDHSGRPRFVVMRGPSAP